MFAIVVFPFCIALEESTKRPQHINNIIIIMILWIVYQKPYPALSTPPHFAINNPRRDRRMHHSLSLINANHYVPPGVHRSFFWIYHVGFLEGGLPLVKTTWTRTVPGKFLSLRLSAERTGWHIHR
jgi:hypothetical protein